MSSQPPSVGLKLMVLDSRFVSFFNSFLELPVWGRTLRFVPDHGFIDRTQLDSIALRRAQDRFNELAPPSGLVQEQPTFRWGSDHQFPLFLISDLYVELSLCKLLTADHENLAEYAGIAQSFTMSQLGTIQGMHAFQDYLDSKTGAACFHFWMDASRLQRWSSNGEATRRSIQSMVERYFRPGAVLKLPPLVRAEMNIKNSEFSKISADNIFRAQEVAMVQLIRFWVPRFLRERQMIASDTTIEVVSKPGAMLQHKSFPPTPHPCHEKRSVIDRKGRLSTSQDLHIGTSLQPQTFHDSTRKVHTLGKRKLTQSTSASQLSSSSPSPSSISSASSKRSMRKSSSGQIKQYSESPRTMLHLHANMQGNDGVSDLDVFEEVISNEMFQPQKSDEIHSVLAVDPVVMQRCLRYDVDAGSPFGRYIVNATSTFKMDPLYLSMYLFCSDAEELRTQVVPHKQVIGNLAALIHGNYIGPSAQYDIGLSQRRRETLRFQLSTNPTTDMYDEVLAEIGKELSVAFAEYLNHNILSFELNAEVDDCFNARQEQLIEFAKAPVSVASEAEQRKRALQVFLNDMFHELVGLLSQTTLYREICEEMLQEFNEGMHEQLAGDSELMETIKLALKGDQSEVFNLKRWLFQVEPEGRAEALLDFRFISDHRLLTEMSKSTKGTEKERDNAIQRRQKGITRKYLATDDDEVDDADDDPTNALIAIESFKKGATDRISKKWIPEFMSTPEYIERQTKRKKTRVRSAASDSSSHLGLGRSLSDGAFDVINFHKLVRNVEGRKRFQKFLMDVNEEGNMLVNDLSFWEEVQRFKILAHQQHRSITLVHDKAQALISQYLDSEIPPQIQIGVPRELAQGIRLKKGPPTKNSIQIYMFRSVEEKTFFNIFQHYPAFVRHAASEKAALLNGDKLNERTARAVERLYLGGGNSRRRGVMVRASIPDINHLPTVRRKSGYRPPSSNMSVLSSGDTAVSTIPSIGDLPNKKRMSIGVLGSSLSAM
eukprot:m.142909 g.142909  ORF g.142909 m.142909 type:complete len:998 (+) comp30280_c0_seq1:267-3260(+)